MSSFVIIFFKHFVQKKHHGEVAGATRLFLVYMQLLPLLLLQTTTYTVLAVAHTSSPTKHLNSARLYGPQLITSIRSHGRSDCVDSCTRLPLSCQLEHRDWRTFWASVELRDLHACHGLLALVDYRPQTRLIVRHDVQRKPL